MTCFIILEMLFFTTSFAYETKLFHDIDYFADKYHKDYIDYNLFDISGNPAFYSLAYTKNLNLYKISAGKKLNAYHRYFDSERTEDINFDLQWIRQLSKNLTMATGAKYYHSYQMNVERSLEKNYYDHYFSFTDTTNGDILFQGPKLWLLLNNKLTKNILLGIEINYGVERGLKDIYTKCETIIRDLDVTTGIVYNSDSQNTQIGLSARYFNRQAKYEAVKEYKEALVNTWFGYHLFLPENPRATNRKNDDREGYELGLQFEQKYLWDTGFGIRLAGNFGEHKNNISVGKPTDTQQRGYWQRSAYQMIGNLFYQSEKFNSQLYVIQSNYSDWAKPKDFDVLALENDEIQKKIGYILGLKLNKKIEFDGGFEITSTSTNYQEFAANFISNEDRNSRFFMVGGEFVVNQISNFHFHGNSGTIEPDFHWQETEQFDLMGFKFGYERQFLFGKLDFCFNYSVFTPDNINKKNEQFGIDIYLFR